MSVSWVCCKFDIYRIYRIKSTGCIRLFIMNGWSDWPENYRCLIIQSIFRYVHILRLLHSVHVYFLHFFYNHTINCIALYSQQQPTAVQSSCRKDESSIFKKDTNYVHWMYEVHWPSVPVSGGGGAELTETSLHSPVTASVDPALESLSGRRLLRAAPRCNCKHKREFYKCVSG